MPMLLQGLNIASNDHLLKAYYHALLILFKRFFIFPSLFLFSSFPFSLFLFRLFFPLSFFIAKQLSVVQSLQPFCNIFPPPPSLSSLPPILHPVSPAPPLPLPPYLHLSSSLSSRE